MRTRYIRSTVVAVLSVAVAGFGPLAHPAGAGPSATPAPRQPAVLQLSKIAEQQIPSFPGPPTASEPDTLVEPDVAVSPTNPKIAVAASHEGRFPDGGAVAIAHAWTTNGGKTWRQASVPGLTKATGGVFDRASDPVLAFAPNGDVYLSTIALNVDDPQCASAVLVSRSTDGGATFAAPVAAQITRDCDIFNDKNWIAVDNGPRSPHRGRIYQVWTLFGSGAEQVARWSDDRGRTWSQTVPMSPAGADTQNSQLVVEADGTLVDTYLDFEFSAEKPEKPDNGVIGGDRALRSVAPEASAGPGVRMMAIRSTDGGVTWSKPRTVAERVGLGPEDVRCCLPSGTIDPVTGRHHVAWLTEDSSRVLTSSSRTGRKWTEPVRSSSAPKAEIQLINVDVAAYNRKVTISTAVRDLSKSKGRYWQQVVFTSYKNGKSFASRLKLGPRYDSKFGAFAGATFPGDYIGTAATRGRTYVVWPVASRPADPAAEFRQVLWGATLRP
jgi:BNR/Asp-box repeat